MKTFSILLLFALITAANLLAVQKSPPRIDEIVLEAVQGDHDLGDPFGPGFKITLRRDGKALFTGKAKVKLIGDFQGTISSEEFEQLQGFLVARNYARLPFDPVTAWRTSPDGHGLSAYASSPYMITSVVYEGGQTKMVRRPTNAQGIDYTHIPKELFEMEQAVFDAATRIRWAKIK